MPHQIFHITHFNNLASILESGGLLCDRRVSQGDVAALGIAHQHIKDRRTQRKVTVGPGGTLCDYVPFYFAARSPMLLSIHTGAVAGYQGDQTQVLHLVSTVEKVDESGLQFVFTDGHAEVAFSSQFTELADLGEVDWSVMPLTWWNDTAEDPDRKRRRQSEFLIYGWAPWQLIESIGVATAQIKASVEAILAAAGDPTPVIVRPDWYY